MKALSIPKLAVLLGITLVIIAFLIPHDSLEFILGQSLRPLGLVTLFINPILGIVGGIASVLKKQWLMLILNILIILSFFITMAIGYSLTV